MSELMKTPDSPAHHGGRTLIILALVFLPLAETVFFSTTGQLRWHSPELMGQLAYWIRLLKIVSISAGLYLLTRSATYLPYGVKRGVLKGLIEVSVILAGTIQLAFLLLGTVFFHSDITHSHYLHKEASGDGETVYVYTSDPGAMGKAYHHIYVKCSLPFGRYELHKLARVDWIGDVDLTLSHGQVELTSKRNNESVSSDIRADASVCK